MPRFDIVSVRCLLTATIRSHLRVKDSDFAGVCVPADARHGSCSCIANVPIAVPLAMSGIHTEGPLPDK